MEQRQLGKYEIRAILGRGAAGVVYEGWDPLIARRVAIKTVRLPDAADDEAADILARCRREAQAAGRLQHPNIVSVFDYGETDNVAYIVMEFVDGTSLKPILDSGEPLAPAETNRIMTALLTGLQYSHDHGVVHRDVKPANIMLTTRRQVKIADFGIARLESSLMTQVGTIMGTPAYMSPEQFMGEPVDGRSDIYSAGVVLYQMLAGERPFDGTMTNIMHKVLHIQPPWPSELSVAAPRALDSIVAKAMAKRPEDRFATAESFSQALQRAFEAPAAHDVAPGDTVVPAPPPKAATPDGPPPREKPSRYTVAIVCAGIALLAGFAGAGWYFVQPSTPTPAAQQAASAEVPPPLLPPVANQVPSPLTGDANTAGPLPKTEIPAPPKPAIAPPASEVPPIAPPSAAPIGLAEARSLADSVPCSLLTVDPESNPDGLRVSGQTSADGAFDAFLQRLRRPDRRVDDATQPLGPGYCSVIDMVSNWVRRQDSSALRLALPGTPIPVGSKLAIAVRGVPAGALIADLYAGNGTVYHLLHRNIPHGGELTIDSPAPGPPGSRLLVAIATPGLPDLTRRPEVENARVYLPYLQHELSRAAADGSSVRAEVALLSVAPAPVPPPEALRSRGPALNPAKCSDIVSRFQLGEAVSDAERAFLRTSCGS
jgi:eukaryotic-like serine/threonine-protein kinase